MLSLRAGPSLHTALLTASDNRFFARPRRVIIPVPGTTHDHSPQTATRRVSSAELHRDRQVRAGVRDDPLPVHTAVVARVREGGPAGHASRNPVWRHADGSFAEW